MQVLFFHPGNFTEVSTKNYEEMRALASILSENGHQLFVSKHSSALAAVTAGIRAATGGELGPALLPPGSLEVDWLVVFPIGVVAETLLLQGVVSLLNTVRSSTMILFVASEGSSDTRMDDRAGVADLPGDPAFRQRLSRWRGQTVLSPEEMCRVMVADCVENAALILNNPYMANAHRQMLWLHGLTEEA